VTNYYLPAVSSYRTIFSPDTTSRVRTTVIFKLLAYK